MPSPTLRESPSGSAIELDSSDIVNVSNVPGQTVTEALDAIAPGGVVDTDNVTNVSSVPGVSASDALDLLQSIIGALTSSDILNASTVAGATVSAALDALLSMSLLPQAGNTVLANAAPGVASPTAFAVGTNTVLGRVAGNLLAAQLVTAQIALNQVTNAVLAQMAANTVKVNATGALADAQDLVVGTNTVLGRVAGNLVAAQLVGAQIATNTVANTNLRQSAALSVIGRSANSTGDAADIAAANNGDVLRRIGGVLAFGTISGGSITIASLTLDLLATQAANTVLVNATTGAASPTALAVGTNTVLGRVAGNIVAAQLVTAQIAVNQVTNAVLAQMAANTVKVNATGALADAQDLAVGTNTVLGRVAGNLVAAQLVDAQVAAATLTLSKLATQAANTALVNATAGIASPTALAVGTNTVLGRVAGNIVAAQAVNAQITGGALGTTKGVAIDGVAGTLQDLTGIEQAENFRRSTIQTILDADIVPGTPFDVALNNDTTVLLVRTNNAQQLRTMLDSTGLAGREVHIEYDPTVSGTLELMQNTAGGIGGSAFFNTNAQRLFLNRTTTIPVRLRSGLWRPVGPAITPWNLSNETAPVGVVSFVRIAVDFTILLGATAGGGGAADDVEIFNVNVPFSMVIKDVFFVTTSTVVGGTVQVRSATGGGGGSLSSILSAAAPGTTRNNLAANLPSAAAGTSMYLRRSDSAISGQLLLTCYRF